MDSRWNTCVNRLLHCHWILHLSIWWFGYLHPIVCPTCTEDEQICLLALRQPGGVNEHQWQTKGKKHSFSIWVKDRLVWTGLTKFKQNSPTLLLKRRVVGRAISKSFLRVTPVCLCFTVYFLCVVCPALCVKTESLFPSSPMLTVKQSLYDEWTLCISSLSEPITTKPKIDLAASKHGHPPSHMLYLLHTFTHMLIVMQCTKYDSHRNVSPPCFLYTHVTVTVRSTVSVAQNVAQNVAHFFYGCQSALKQHDLVCSAALLLCVCLCVCFNISDRLTESVCGSHIVCPPPFFF